MSNHTPGPWHARKGDVLNPNRPWGVVKLLTAEECEAVDGNLFLLGTRSTVVVEVCAADSEEIEEADARLIAAAPDMLEALQQVRDSGAFECCCGQTPCCGSCISTMVARAIEKARGDDRAENHQPNEEKV